jgi:hypothetical protein
MSEKKEKTGNVEVKTEAKPPAAEEKPSEVGVFVCN